MDVRPGGPDEQSLLAELKSSMALFTAALACTAGLATVGRVAVRLLG